MLASKLAVTEEDDERLATYRNAARANPDFYQVSGPRGWGWGSFDHDGGPVIVNLGDLRPSR